MRYGGSALLELQRRIKRRAILCVHTAGGKGTAAWLQRCDDAMAAQRLLYRRAHPLRK